MRWTVKSAQPKQHAFAQKMPEAVAIASYKFANTKDSGRQMSFQIY